jgi:hypothetical protein
MQVKRKLTLDDFKYMEQLELKYYSEEHVTPYEEAYKWHLVNPDTSSVLEEGGRIIGFIDMLPLKKAIIEKILSGSFNDKYLKADDIVAMEKLREGESVDLLLSCIVVDKEYRKTDALKILLDDKMEYYRNFVKKGIVIDSIITSNVTEDGIRFSERMGFQRVGTSEHGTALFRTTFREFDERIKAMRPKPYRPAAAVGQKE